MKTYRGIAKVVKPLRYLRSKCQRQIIENGKRRTVYEAPYPEAEWCAKQGDGASVQRLAMMVARG